jgi:hypothetical protein
LEQKEEREVSELTGKHIIGLWQRKWKTKIIFSYFLLASSVTILLSTLLYKTVLFPIRISIPLFLIIFLLLISIRKQWKITEWDVSRFLNQAYPELQESSHLILKPSESLNFLQTLQAEKVKEVLLKIKEPKHFNQKLRSSVYILSLTLALSFILFKLPFSFSNSFTSAKPGVVTPPGPPAMPKKVLREISLVSVKIFPPVYANKSVREQAKLNLVVEEGGDVAWQLTTNVHVGSLKLLFNDNQVLTLRSINNEHTIWTGRRTFNKSGFYQVAIDNKLSEYYKVEIIKDVPPVIRIQKPAPHTVIDFGVPEKVMLAVALSDDYGIQNTSVSATPLKRKRRSC